MRIGKHKVALAKKGFMPVSEAAKKVGFDAGTLTRWAEEGVIHSIHVAGVRFIEFKSLLTHIGPEASALLGIK